MELDPRTIFGTGTQVLKQREYESTHTVSLDSYSSIAIVSTLLAGFTLEIFPNTHDTSSYVNMAYNFTMGVSFILNVIITIIMTLQLYFTQRLISHYPVSVARRFMTDTQYIRHMAVSSLFQLSLPLFSISICLLMFITIDNISAIAISIVMIFGVFLMTICRYIYFQKFIRLVDNYSLNDKCEINVEFGSLSPGSIKN